MTYDGTKVMVEPTNYARCYLPGHPGPFRMVIKDKIAHFYEGRKKVFSCNLVFAKCHFTKVKAPRARKKRAGLRAKKR